MKKIYINDAFSSVNNEILKQYFEFLPRDVLRDIRYGFSTKKHNYKIIAQTMKQKQAEEYKELAGHISKLYQKLESYYQKLGEPIDLTNSYINTLSSFFMLNIELIDSYKSEMQIDLSEAIRTFTDDKERQLKILSEATKRARDSYINEKEDTRRYFDDVMTYYISNKNKIKENLKNKIADSQPGE